MSTPVNAYTIKVPADKMAKTILKGNNAQEVIMALILQNRTHQATIESLEREIDSLERQKKDAQTHLRSVLSSIESLILQTR